ncbi:type III-B CRISPR module RAMP protein Cmr4 [Prolixibacteraceae bacterium JC049]|nr:type III-B CRISPR module RAMP protein Cmr4 [Prolixibacteraceae bacterium JC049]
MIAKYYTITALTNLHVGSGDNNTSVIDKQIQRDATTGLPCIYGSSLKGALKEFFDNESQKENPEITKAQVKKIFGTEEQTAAYRFLSADLLALPLRSNVKPYYLATSASVIEEFKNKLKDFKIGNIDENIPTTVNNPMIYEPTDQHRLVEDFETFRSLSIDTYPTNLLQFMPDKKKTIILSDEDLKRYCNDSHLPVIARNKIGENNNLWYEQLLPRQTILGFAVLFNDEDETFNAFNELLTNESIIHIGANATVGMGFCKIRSLTI